MISIEFTADSGLPRAPPQTRLRELGYRTCPGSDLRIRLAQVVRDGLDERGVPADAWWVVTCSGLPDRTMRLFGGSQSLAQLLRRYGFQDATGCVNHREVTARYAPAAEPVPRAALAVPQHLLETRGVPQFYRNSGVCWFAALCWTSFSNERMASFLRQYMPDELRALSEKCLTSRDAAEGFRKKLWYDFSVGDDVEDRPENDGRNGFSEFMTLCAKLKVPMLLFEEADGAYEVLHEDAVDRKGRRWQTTKPDRCDEPHLLVIRYSDGAHHTKFPFERRVVHKKKRYGLVGVYMGQRKCGHQIAMACPTRDWRNWSLGDADLHKDGIGPIHVRFEGPEWAKGSRWWDAWRELVHVTKFGPGYTQMCNLSPHNERTDPLSRGGGAYRRAKSRGSYRGGGGSNSCDLVYMSL